LWGEFASTFDEEAQAYVTEEVDRNRDAIDAFVQRKTWRGNGRWLWAQSRA